MSLWIDWNFIQRRLPALGPLGSTNSQPGDYFFFSCLLVCIILRRFLLWELSSYCRQSTVLRGTKMKFSKHTFYPLLLLKERQFASWKEPSCPIYFPQCVKSHCTVHCYRLRCEHRGGIAWWDGGWRRLRGMTLELNFDGEINFLIQPTNIY